jgi:hypothetical protein
MARTTWRDREVRALLEECARRGIDDTTAAAAIFSKGHHPNWQNRTGTAEGSIRGQPARRERGGIVGRFGSFDVDYFIWLEIGANGHPGDNTLRRGADAEFPKAPQRIAAWWRRLAR